LDIKTISIALHMLSAVVWVGGMFFAYMALRPVAAQQLQPPQRLTLWVGVFGKFFPFVWLSVLFLLTTGYTMIFVIWGGFAATPKYVHIMNGLGIVMILIYMHVYFAPYRRLREAVQIENWQEGGRRLGQIRRLIGINLSIGLIVVLIASAGRYLGA